MPESPPDPLFKAADIVKSFAVDLGKNVHFIFAIVCISLFLSVGCNSWFPSHVNDYRWLSVAILIFSVSYWGSLLYFAHKPTRVKLWHLKSIGTDERNILVGYLREDRTCRTFYALHGPVMSLIAKGILRYASSMIPLHDAQVMIDPYVMLHLRDHPEILKLSKSDIGGVPLSEDRPQPFDHIGENYLDKAQRP